MAKSDPIKSRLEIALKARIPLVSTTTRDTSTINQVIRSIGRANCQPVKTWDGDIDTITKQCVLAFVGSPFGGTNGAKAKTDLTPEKAYQMFKHQEATLVIVNAKGLSPLFYEAGEAPTPHNLMLDLVQMAIPDEGQAKDVIMGLGGMTMLEAEWAMRMTSARKSPLTRAGITATRKKYFPSRAGLEQVSTDHLVYQSPKMLDEWLKVQHHFILDEEDHSLRPKGLLFGGPPGTGKTAGAKYVARELGIPLFRFDASQVKSKWVGESESNLTSTLESAAHEAPCVLLMDEVEKLFSYSNIGDTSGVTKSLLGQFLWFLQESEARVLICMTTNDAGAIPKELIRPGRIDSKMIFEGLTPEEVKGFCELMLGRYDMAPDAAFKALAKELREKCKLEDHLPQAEVENTVIQYVKNRIIKTKLAKAKKAKD